MALEKILHDSPFRSINKYLAHYHPDPAGWCYSSPSQSLHISPAACLLHTNHVMLQTCCTCFLCSAWHGVVQCALALRHDTADMIALTYAFL